MSFLFRALLAGFASIFVFGVSGFCGLAEKPQEQDSLETAFNALESQYLILGRLKYCIKYKKTWERNGDELLKFYSSIPNYPPEDLAKMPLKRPILVVYCAGYFQKDSIADHYIESTVDNGVEKIQKNIKYFFDGSMSHYLSFPPCNTIQDALADKRLPSAERREKGRGWGYPEGEGAPIDVLTKFLGFGGGAKQSLDVRMRTFFGRAKKISVINTKDRLIEVTAEFPNKDLVRYTFDLNKGGMISEWTSKTAANTTSVVKFNYIESAQGELKAFLPKRIDAKTSFVDNGGEHLMSHKVCEFIVMKLKDFNIKSESLDSLCEEISWEGFK